MKRVSAALLVFVFIAVFAPTAQACEQCQSYRTLQPPHPPDPLDFKRLPLISGRVVDAQTRTALAGALVTTDSGTGVVADAAGEFRLAADPESWPKALTVTAPDRASRAIQLPAARADTRLGAIELSRAAMIGITLLAAPGQVRTLELLQVADGGRSRKRRVDSIILTGVDAAPPRFEGVESGSYVVVAMGDRAWERMAHPVIVAAGEHTNVELNVEPFDLRMHVADGDAAVTNRRILLRHRDLHWEGEFETDAAGEATLGLWQGGPLQATVVREGQLPYFARREISAADEEWRIVLPSLEIRGVVVDAETGDPIPRAALALRMKSEEGYTLSVDSRTDAKGTFAFAPAVYGTHTLMGAAAGYPPAELRVDFHAPDASRDVTVRLRRGKTIRLAVADERGRSLAGAIVIVYAGLWEEARAVTDGAGRAEVAVTQPRTLFVIPRDGSFAVTSLRPEEAEKQIVVREGIARIELRAQGGPHEPIPDVSVVTRYNGTVLPVDVVHTLAAMHGWRQRADAEGRIIYTHVPPGTYEFWPVGSTAEYIELSAGVGPRAPVTMAVGAGENVAVLSFKRVTASTSPETGIRP